MKKKIYKTLELLAFYFFIVSSSIIWLPISVYKFGIVFSDHVKRFLIKTNEK